HLLVDPDGRIYAHHSMSFHAHAAGLRVHLTFHNGALYQVSQSVPVNYDSCIIDFYKPSYDVDSSSDVVLNLRYPFPSSETYHHCNALNGHLFYITRHFLE